MSALLDGPWKNPRSAYPTSPPIRVEAEFPIFPGTEQLHLGVCWRCSPFPSSGSS
jgi:ABC-type uncharacterized transport system, permease component